MKRITPSIVFGLKNNQIFVFGSNLKGHHDGGAARLAFQQFGAVYGKGIGSQGNSYAIPTMFDSHLEIKPYIDDFIREAKANPELEFLVTEIGCGIAGFKAEQIAPLFMEAAELNNIYLPEKFWKLLERVGMC